MDNEIEKIIELEKEKEFKKEKELKKVNKHLYKLWSLSKKLYIEGDYPTASFFAITLIEEIGKAIIIYRNNFNKKDFYNHNKKYRIGVALTLIVNSRVARTYKYLEKRFAKWYRDNEIFRIRNDSLYVDYENEKVYLPEEKINKEEAFTLVVMAGEIFAEIQGDFVGAHPYYNWDYILKEVEEFRDKYKENFEI
jgi:AbiV family abortive infection protein